MKTNLFAVAFFLVLSFGQGCKQDRFRRANFDTQFIYGKYRLLGYFPEDSVFLNAVPIKGLPADSGGSQVTLEILPDKTFRGQLTVNSYSGLAEISDFSAAPGYAVFRVKNSSCTRFALTPEQNVAETTFLSRLSSSGVATLAVNMQNQLSLLRLAGNDPAHALVFIKIR